MYTISTKHGNVARQLIALNELFEGSGITEETIEAIFGILIYFPRPEDPTLDEVEELRDKYAQLVNSKTAEHVTHMMRQVADAIERYTK